MSINTNTGVIGKAKNLFNTAKEYWSVPPKGNYIAYKEVASLSGAGFGVHWLTLLASAIGLNAGNFLVGASIGLKPMDLQIMLIVANLVGMPLGVFRGWYYDNHNLKGGKFLPFIQRTAVPIVLVTTVFVWLPYENWEYLTKAVVVWFMYMLLNVFLCFYNESYMYFQQIITPDAQERANVMSISQVIYSLAPTLTNLFIPILASLTGGLDNIWTYRIIYPVFTVIGLIMSLFFFRKVKERIILPKKKPEPVRMLDAIREVAKNKYYWIIQIAAWVVFLESGYGVILGWSFVYAYDGMYEASLGVANTVIGNAALWSMLLTPLAIKYMGKRNLLITANTVNIVLLIILYFTYRNLIVICIIWYVNSFVNTFWNIVQHNINADMRDYHQWKTGVRVDGLFAPLGMIGTIISFFSGLFYPAIYEKMGLHEDYSVLYDDNIRNNIFEVLIICSAFGALLNLIPFFFYDLTENKHKGYIEVIKIRTMFENYSLGNLEDAELVEGFEIIRRARAHYVTSIATVNKAQLEAARKLPHKTPHEKAVRSSAIKEAKKLIRQCKETNQIIERSATVIDDLNKFSTPAGKLRIAQAQKDVSDGLCCFYFNAEAMLEAAKALPKKTDEQKEIRSDAIKNARIKKEAASLIKRYGAENITPPDESVKAEIINRETKGFTQSLAQRRELRAYLKRESIYNRVAKPYTDACRLLEQQESYTHLEELENRYLALVSAQA